MSERVKAFLSLTVAILGGVFALGGVWLGNELGSRNAARLAKEERLRELRLQSYQRLAALEPTWRHAVEAVQFARADYSYWSARHDYITREPADFERAIDAEKNIDVQVAAAERVRRELYETLATIELVFDIDSATAAAIEHYKLASNAVSIGDPNVRPTDEADLRRWFNSTTAEMSRRASNLALASRGVTARLAPQLRADLRKPSWRATSAR